MKRPSTSKPQSATVRPAPIKPPSAEVIGGMADRVMAGQVVDADLTDGTFSLLMAELRRRGMTLQPRDESTKHLKPFLFHVGQSQH